MVVYTERSLLDVDFACTVKNPYAAALKKQITIRLNSCTIEYFKNMAKEVGVPYQTLIDF